MTDQTDQSATTEVTDPSNGTAEPVKELRPFTGVWEDLTHGEYKAMLEDIKTEAEAAIASGEPTLQKWARTSGTFASLLLSFLTGTGPAE